MTFTGNPDKGTKNWIVSFTIGKRKVRVMAKNVNSAEEALALVKQKYNHPWMHGFKCLSKE